MQVTPKASILVPSEVGYERIEWNTNIIETKRRQKQSPTFIFDEVYYETFLICFDVFIGS